MVTRQRRSRGDRSASTSTGYHAVSPGQPSRLKSLLFILAITTTLLIALQLHRHINKTGQVWQAESSSSSQEGKLGNKHRGEEKITGGRKRGFLNQVGEVDKDDDEVRRRMAALGKQLQEEFSKVSSSTGKMGPPAIVPGQGVQDHESPREETESGSTSTRRPRHVEGKDEVQAEEDRQIALQDLDQDTLKAMMDLLYARE